ncbi:MAG: asparagine--tRNA ligase [Candidatus Bathyarchaeota archaeon]|nr:MAG: asparagine--tRNA ligase [Candidatus Bathyarchaeota archaeon]
MSFTPIEDVIDGRHEGEHVDIRGWVYRKRESKDTVFLVIRDATNIVQCTVKRGSSAWSVAKEVTIESSVNLSGIVRGDKRAPGGFEISTDKLSIIGLAEVFPITKDQSEEFLRDVRHLWLRSQRMGAIMKVRSEVLNFVHEFFKKRGFVGVSPPMFISSACEGGATLFGLKYFDKDLYLTQSAQLHLEVLIYSLEKVYCVAPSFRAEKSRTIRHLSEYWHVEAEQAFTTIEDMMSLQEDLVSYVCHRVAEECKKELESLGVDAEKLAKVNTPFKRITYDDALKLLQKRGFKIEWGEDFGFEEERVLAEEFGYVFVYAYPKRIKAFYCKTYRENSELAMSVDLIVPRIGELTTGGARVDDKEELIERLEEFGLKQEDYEWYIDLRRYGTVPHTGFGLGVERLLAWMLNLESVMDTIPFPRTIRRFYP